MRPEERDAAYLWDMLQTARDAVAIIGLRNILAHDYGRIDHDRLYATAVKEIPPLIAELEQLQMDREP